MPEELKIGDKVKFGPDCKKGGRMGCPYILVGAPVYEVKGITPRGYIQINSGRGKGLTQYSPKSLIKVDDVLTCEI